MSEIVEKVSRCTACRSEFTAADLREGTDDPVTACPKCGSKGVPSDPRKDTTITINPHELRILTIWASNWATEKCTDDNRRSLKGLLGALSKQLPGVPLTLRAEFQEIADEFGSRVEVHQGGDVTIFEGKKPS